ncbi:MAG: DUF2314 domain-containing protein [Planctomycetes bacterium]|nr:DUF2314 domain-containing protein [Planctomycetota bacterium]
MIAGSTSTPSRSPLSRWLTILFPVLCAVGFVQNALASGELAWLLLVPPALVVSALLWREWPGASLCGALWFAGCGAERIARLFHEGGALHAVIGVLFGWWALQIWRGEGAPEDLQETEPQRDARSRVPKHLIALLSDLPPADEAWVRAAFERAMPNTPARVDRHRDGFFTIQWLGGAMALRVMERTAGAEGVLAGLAPNLARDHRAALGVVPLVRENGGDLHAIEAVIGRFLAELVARGCIALGASDAERWVPFELDLPMVLRSGEPWRALELQPATANSRGARAAALAAAAETARARFSEFGDSFERRAEASPCGPFWVKAPFAEGAEVEELWIRVEALDGDSILGLVASEALHSKRLAYGEPVEVDRGRISDWMFLRGEEPVGFFGSSALLADRQRKSSR